jgi:hypothetical protein
MVSNAARTSPVPKRGCGPSNRPLMIRKGHCGIVSRSRSRLLGCIRQGGISGGEGGTRGALVVRVLCAVYVWGGWLLSLIGAHPGIVTPILVWIQRNISKLLIIGVVLITSLGPPDDLSADISKTVRTRTRRL